MDLPLAGRDDWHVSTNPDRVGDTTRRSKRLSYVLRHDPASVGVRLDEAGWVEVDVLLRALARHGLPLTRAELEHVVETNDKRRFVIDGDRIRASQGHSIPVDLGLAAMDPPAELYHGTARHHLRGILAEGLRAGGRHDVHLSPDVDTARRVGRRHGVPVVLVVDSGAMARHGHEFRRSANGVWLTAAVPAAYLRVT